MADRSVRLAAERHPGAWRIDGRPDRDDRQSQQPAGAILVRRLGPDAADHAAGIRLHTADAATVGQPFRYVVQAHDPQSGGAVDHALDAAPPGMTLNAQTGELLWTPSANTPTQVTIVLEAVTTLGSHATQAFSLNVAGGNHLPVFAALPSTISRAEGQMLVLSVMASDADGDSLVYWADHLPPGALFNTVTHTLLWAPGYQAAGTYNSVTFYASDGKSQVSTSVTVLVSPVTQPPTLARPADRTIAEGDPLRFTLIGRQADGLPATYSAEGLPAHSTLDPNTGVFQWTPWYNQWAATTWCSPRIVPVSIRPQCESASRSLP